MASLKQNVLRLFYPFIRNIGKRGKNGTILENKKGIIPPVHFHDQKAILNNGKEIAFASLVGRKVLLVNTASDCGYTGQYAELQTLHEKHGNKLTVIAFPANDFGEQEKKADDEIEKFCQLNYGVSFPIAKKATVVKKSGQDPVFRWLTDSTYNGWNDHAPDWNFSKYLIDETGRLTHYFGPSISPLSDEFLGAVANDNKGNGV